MPVSDLFARLENRLRQGRNGYRNRLLMAGLLRTVTVSAGILLLALFVTALLSGFPRVYAPIAAGTVLTLIAAAVYFLLLPLLRAPGLTAYAQWIESRVPAARSLLVNALEFAPILSRQSAMRGGTSPDLAAALIAQAEKKSAEIPFAEHAPRAFPSRWTKALAAVAAVWAVSFLFASGPLMNAGWGLLHPSQAIARGVAFSVWPGDTRIAPGSDLHVQTNVLGTDERPVLIASLSGEDVRIEMDEGTAPGAPAYEEGMAGATPYRARVPAVSAPGFYRIEVGTSSSPIYTISLTGSVAPVSFDLTYDYPDYTNRPTEVQSVPRADLVALKGTEVTVGVNLDREIERVSWSLDGELTREDARRWIGQTVIDGSGSYDVELHDGDRPYKMTFRIEEIADRLPVLTVLDPSGDMDLPVGQKIPLRVTATDDFGLTDLRLIYQLEGQEAEGRTLSRWSEEPREATAGHTWDLSDLGMLPGQRVTFYFALRDNDRISGPKVVESGRYVVRFPLLSEIYEDIEETNEMTIADLEDVAREARELAEQVEETRREMEQRNRGGRSTNSWEQKQQAKELAERQEAIAERMEQIADEFQEMTERAAEREAFRDEIQEKMAEISKLMKELESPELREAMEELRRSMEQTDPRNLENELQQLLANQEQLLKNLERTIELLERVRQEERLEAAAQRAEELAERQEGLNQQMQNESSGEQMEQLGEAEQQAAQDAEQLQEDLRDLAAELEESGRQESAEEAGEARQQLQEEATPSLQDAAQQLQQGRRQQASQSGQQAQQSLQQVAQNLRDAAESLSQQVDQEQLEAVRRAAQDLVNLSQRQEESLQQGGDPRERARRQEDLREGAERVADDLFDVAKRTPFLNEDAARHLGDALQRIERSSEAFDRGVPVEGERQGQEASNSLNEAVLSLRDAEQSMCENGQQQGGQKSGRQQMQQMVGQQQQLNRDTQSLSQRLAQQQRMLASDEEAMKQLAARQEAIRRGMQEAIDSDQEGRMLGRLDQTKEDMEEVARELERRNLDTEVLARQQKILSRMLDAQRSVNRREFEEQRQSRAGDAVAREAPAELPSELLQPEAQLDHSLLRAHSERYAPEYRDLVESYLRRLQESR